MLILDFNPMTEGDMAEYLGEIEGLNEKLLAMIQDEYTHLETLEECIRRNTFHGQPDGPAVKSGPKGDAAYYTLRAVYREMDRQVEELTMEVMKIMEGQEKLRYVNHCIRMLPCDQAELIGRLYVQREKQENYAKEKCISLPTLRRRRKTAMDNLLVLYNSYFREDAGNKRDICNSTLKVKQGESREGEK